MPNISLIVDSEADEDRLIEELAAPALFLEKTDMPPSLLDQNPSDLSLKRFGSLVVLNPYGSGAARI